MMELELSPGERFLPGCRQRIVRTIFSLATVLTGFIPGLVHALESPGFTLKNDHWEQLVIPANSSASSVRELFSGSLAVSGYNTTWTIFRYNAQTGRYFNPRLDDSIPQGAGFWMIQSTGVPVTVVLPAGIPAGSTETDAVCAVSECASVVLRSRASATVFNLLGTGLAQSSEVRGIRLATSGDCVAGCSLDEAANLQLLARQWWHYDSTQERYRNIASEARIEPWQAFWVPARSELGGADAVLWFPVSSQLSPALAQRAEASRFLAQTTFGPTTHSIDLLLQTGYSDWIDAQIDLPGSSMLDAFDALQASNQASAPSRDWIFETFWAHAVTAQDQLRQRVAFALSQIFVISLREGAVAAFPRGVADFYTLLSNGAFGNFRELLESVTLHPMMGSYLSHLGNEKGDITTGKVPDENFAREIMQLFSIGLQQLNADGSVVLDENGMPVETYSNSDVQGLARVFTGFSWDGPDTSTGRFQGWISVPDRDVRLMQPYPQFHSTLAKQFLGTVIGAQATPDPEADLAIALDTLFNHPNVGPFIGRQLIQRLVTSNPDKRYIENVTAAFNDNGEGVRGDMRAVIRAVLLDPQARDISLISGPAAGRIREPVLRLAHWMRSVNVESPDGRYIILGTDDPATSLGMTVLRSPSVFNFYRPGYVPSNTPVAEAGLVSPEMQITHETSVAGYLNSMLNAVELGTGSGNNLKSEYLEAAALAADPQTLIDHVNVLFMHGAMSDELQGWLREAIESVDLLANGSERLPAMQRRARLAVYLAMSSPEYIVLK